MIHLTLPDEQFTVALRNESSSQFAALNKTLIEALSSAMVGLDNTLVRYVGFVPLPGIRWINGSIVLLIIVADKLRPLAVTEVMFRSDIGTSGRQNEEKADGVDD